MKNIITFTDDHLNSKKFTQNIEKKSLKLQNAINNLSNSIHIHSSFTVDVKDFLLFVVVKFFSSTCCGVFRVR